MPAPEPIAVARPLPRPAKRSFAELSMVGLGHAVPVEGRFLPAGSRGTVVGVYRDGYGYEVEFTRPFHAIVTLHVDDLTA